MAIYPHAKVRLIPKWNSRKMTSYNLAILHVTAAETPSQYGYFSSTNKVCSHFHVAKDGIVEQYIDTKFKDAASCKANGYSIGIETQGADSLGTWTPAQADSIARLLAWLHATHNIPLTPVYDSKYGRCGVGYHSLGVPASRWQKLRGVSQTGGQLWSTATGKVCPGLNRIKQIPEIIAKARAYSSYPTDRLVFSTPTKIKEDGNVGNETIECAQRIAGTFVDGEITGQSEYNRKFYFALYAVKYATAEAIRSYLAARRAGHDNNRAGSLLVKALQIQLKVDSDGLLGEKTIKALQRKLGVKDDGLLGHKTALAWQKALNQGRLC